MTTTNQEPQTPTEPPTDRQCQDCKAAKGYLYAHTPRGTTNTTLYRLCPQCFMTRYPHLFTKKPN